MNSNADRSIAQSLSLHSSPQEFSQPNNQQETPQMMSQPGDSPRNLYGESLSPATVVRVHRHEKDFLIVANATVQDDRLSWEARGLLIYLLSLPADWDIRISHLQKQGGAGRDALRRMLRELQKLGYASGVGRENQERGGHGRFGQTEVRVYESPALNPFFAQEKSPSPENPSTAGQPSAVSPSPDLPSPENPSTYKEQSPQRTHKTNHTHKQNSLRAVGASDVVVGGDSKFSLEDCRRYADHLHASGQGVTNPGGFARTIHRTGSEDSQITIWLAEVDPECVRSGELLAPTQKDTSACPDCQGKGMYYPDPANPGKGVAKCRHPQLTKVA